MGALGVSQCVDLMVGGLAVGDRTPVRNALRQTDYQSVRRPFKFDQKGDPTLVTHVVRIVDVKETDARS
jgi:branched-chain amino acid transport system substrate-binding protein